MAKLHLCTWLLLVMLSGCEAVQPPKPVAMPVEPMLGEFTVFEQLHDGFIQSQRHGGGIKIEPIEGDAEGCRVSAEPAIIFRFDPRSGTLTPDPTQVSSSSIIEIAVGQAGSANPPSLSYVPVPVYPMDCVIISYLFQQLFLVRGQGPEYWAIVPTNLPPGVERIEDWADNHWSYKYEVKRKGSRSELEIGELTLKGEPVHGKPGQIIFTPIGKFRSNGDLPRQYGSQGWFEVMQ